MGCHHMQGYFFSRPMPADEAQGYLQRVADYGLLPAPPLR